MKNKLTSLVKIIIAIALIYWLINSGKIDLVSLKALLTPLSILVCSALVIIGFTLNNERWRTLLSSQNVNNNFGATMKLTFIGLFFNFAMPGGVGGDIIKGFYFYKDNPQAKTVAVTSVVFDRIIGLYAMVMMAFAVLILDYEQVRSNITLTKLVYIIGFLFFGFSFALLLIFSKKIYSRQTLHSIFKKLPASHKFIHLYETCHIYGNNPLSLLKGIFLSFLSQACSILMLFYCGLQISDSSPQLMTYFLVAPLAFMATAIPISPAGVGVGQAAFYFLFKEITGKENDIGATVITALQAFQFIIGLAGAYFYLLRKDKIDEKSVTASQV